MGGEGGGRQDALAAGRAAYLALAGPAADGASPFLLAPFAAGQLEVSFGVGCQSFSIAGIAWGLSARADCSLHNWSGQGGALNPAQVGPLTCVWVSV